MNNLKKIVLLSVSVSLLQPAFSQPIAISSEKFAKMIYRVPAGWKLTKYQDGVRLSPADLPTGEYLAIQVMKPADLTGTIEQALEKSYDETCSLLQVTKMHDVNGQNYIAREAKKSFRGWEYIRCSGGIPALAPGSGTYELKNHSIIFQYSDGRKIKIAFTEAGFDKNNADPSSTIVVGFNNDVLKRIN